MKLISILLLFLTIASVFSSGTKVDSTQQSILLQEGKRSLYFKQTIDTQISQLENSIKLRVYFELLLGFVILYLLWKMIEFSEYSYNLQNEGNASDSSKSHSSLQTTELEQ